MEVLKLSLVNLTLKNKLMKLTLTFFVFFITFLGLAQPNGNQIIDKVSAQVGDDIILKSDIEAQKAQMIQAKMEVNEKTDCTILEELMYRSLLLNQAKLDSLVVQDAQVEAEIDQQIRMIEQQMKGYKDPSGNPITFESYYGKSKAQMKEEYREPMRNRKLAEEMEFKITENLSVTPTEVKAYFKTVPDDSIPYINAKLSFQQIVIFPEVTDNDKKIAFNKLNDIRNSILGGKSFESQARIHSEDPGSAANGGKYEATKGMMVPQFDAAVFSLKVGEVSPIFETQYGYHIVTLLDRRGDDYICRHILIVPKYSTEALHKAVYRMDSCYNELKQNLITWDQAVLKYSNDEATMRNHGIITNPMTGEQTWDMEDLSQIDQQIFVLTDALSKGDITSPNMYTDIYERKEGVRIVRLMNRFEPHKANLNDDFTLIKQAAENDKKTKMIDKWVKGKIPGAYIKIDDSLKSCQFKHQWIHLNN